MRNTQHKVDTGTSSNKEKAVESIVNCLNTELRKKSGNGLVRASGKMKSCPDFVRLKFTGHLDPDSRSWLRNFLVSEKFRKEIAPDMKQVGIPAFRMKCNSRWCRETEYVWYIIPERGLRPRP